MRQADAVAQAVLKRFDELPKPYKPHVRDNGLHEWVPLSGIVAEHHGHLTCLSLATGMKCLPANKIAESAGIGLHDWHAEVLAIRAFNRFLLDECRAVAEGERSDFLEKAKNCKIQQPFQIRSGVKLHMYCSQVPCGDASMELTMAEQDDAAPWADSETALAPDGSLRGRGNFSQLGVVRRKPGRADAPHTLSKSCSDKLSLKQCTSLLSSLSFLFIHPGNAYISSLIMPESQLVQSAIDRAFSHQGRMAPVEGKTWPGGFVFRPFSVDITGQEYTYSKEAVGQRTENFGATNRGVGWSLGSSAEAIIGGVLQGRKAFMRKGATRTSRVEMWTAARNLAHLLNEDGLKQLFESETYHDVKAAPVLAERRQVKADVVEEALAGWINNSEGSGFRITSRGDESKLRPAS